MDYLIALNQILILFLLVAAGFFCRKIGILDEGSVSKLSKFLLHICIPAMVIYSMQIPFNEGTFENSAYLFVAALIYYCIAFVIAWFAPIILRAKREEYGIFRFMIMFSNSMFMGFPIISMIYGSYAIFYAAVFNIPFTILSYSVGIWLLKKKGGAKFSFSPKILLNAAFISTIAGLVFFLTSFQIPDPIYGALGLLDDVTTPLSLVVTGGFLAGLNFKSIFTNVRQYFLAGIRLVIMPLVTFLVFSQFITNPVVLGIIVVTAGMPAAVNTVILADEYGSNAKIAAQGVFISTLLCIATLPLLAVFLA
ncbi:MAG: AEC family transporter [Methanocorpusculum sp.]|nr:AEC family transporter [Methanocorpusculum sp.]